MTDHDKPLYRLAAWASLVIVLLTIAAWAGLSRIVVLPGEMGIVGRARLVAVQPWEWSLPFILLAIAAIIQFPVVMAVASLTRKRPLHSRLAMVYGMVGTTLASLSLFMQATVTRKAAIKMMADNNERVKAAYLAQSTGWNIMYYHTMAYAMSLLYQIFLAAMLLALALAWTREKGLKKAIAVLCVIAVASQVVGTTGYVMDQKQLLAGAWLFDVLFAIFLTLMIIVFMRESRYKAS